MEPDVAPQTPEFNVAPIIAPSETPFEVDASHSEVGPTSSVETMDRRSKLIKYGLSDIIKKTQEEIYGELAQGNEMGVRETAAAEIDKRKAASLEATLTKAAQNKGSALSTEETAGLTSIVLNLSKQTNPDTVFEEAYGKQFLGTLDQVAQAKPDSFLNDAKQKFPDETAKLLNDGGSLVAKRQVLLTMKENIDDEAKAQGWIGWGYDQVKYLIPGYTDVQLRGNVGRTGVFSGGVLSQNLENQRTELLRMPVDDMQRELTRIVEPMKRANPTLAKQFIDSMLGASYSERLFTSATLPLDLAGLGLGKAGLKGVRAGIKAVKGEGTLIKDVEKATDDMARAASDPLISKSGIEAAAGDLKESAVTKATTNLTAEVAGTPEYTRRGVESLSTGLRTDIEAIKANPGKFGREIVNRLEEQNNIITNDVLTLAQTIQKVEGLPEVMANQTSVRLIIDAMKDKYTGLRNTIVDNIQPYKDSLTGKYFADFHLGNADGTYFTQRSVAENFIKFHGLGSGEIIEGTDKNLTKAAKGLNQIKKNIADAESTISKIEKRLKEDKYGTPEKKAKDEETLGFLRDEAIPGFKAKLEPAAAQKATVEQQGLGFYVKVTKPVAETDDIVRDVIATTTNTQIPQNTLSSFFNAWGIGKYRTPEDTLSKAERSNRLVVTYAPSEFFKILKDNSPSIDKLSKEASRKGSRFSNAAKKWEEFQRVLENGQELWDTATKQKGYFFQSPAELETNYLSWFKRLPDKDEIAAYFEFKRGMEIDRVMRNIAEHRNQTRVGAETHKVIAVDDTGKSIPSPEFSAVTRNKIGGSTDNIAIIDNIYGREKVSNLGKWTTKDKEEWQKLIDSGEYKYMEIYNTDLKPLKGYGNIGDAKIRYVLAKVSEVKELDWNHIPRRGGGHVEYDYANYLKQGKVEWDDIAGVHWYNGDTTIMPIQIRKMGQDVADHLNKVRELFKAKDEIAARDYSNKNLHIEWDTVRGWFKGELQQDGTWKGARLGLNEPIQVVPRGKSIIDIDNSMAMRPEYKGKLRNGNKEGNLAKQSRVEFTEERDAHDVFTLDNKGTAANPLYEVAQAEKIDPITSLNRGLTRIAKSNFMDDYKTMSVEHWLKQAQNYLNATESEIRHSPFYYFREAKFLPGTDPMIRGQLETAKSHIEQLIGQPSDTAVKLHALSQSLADSTYSKLGTNSVLSPEWDLAKLKDPFSVARTITYHAKMGLWNIPQFIVQAGNYSNILGIAGARYATGGTLGAQVHFWSRVNSNPKMIDFWDNMVSKFRLPGTAGFKPGQFKEAFEEFKKTGFGNVGGEYAALDDPMNQKIVTSMGQSMLDSSTMFVNGGERNSRYGAWYTSYLEFRDKKPLGRITDEDRAEILQRADLLNINMSRASSSALHSGMMSIPTQFYTYQIRLTELFASSRLTPYEKFRMFYTNSLLYGIPMGAGLSAIPFSALIRQKAAEQGYVVGDNFFSSAAMEGLVSALGATITGGGDPQAGTWYDVGDRFGTKGLEFLGGVNKSDKSWLDIMGGPAWSLLKGSIEQTDGFQRVMGNLINPDENDMFPWDVNDIIDPLKEISSVNSGFRLLAAWHTGRHISKKESWLADVSGIQATFTALTSLKDQRINDIQTFRNANENQKEYNKKIEQMFLQEYRRGVLASKDDNETEATKFFTRAKVILHRMGYPEDQVSTLLNRAARDNQSVLDRVTFEFYRKRPNNTEKDIGIDALKRTERVKAKQRGDE